MDVYAVYTTAPQGKTVRKFRNEKEAFNLGNGYNLVKSAKELAEKKQIKLQDLNEIHANLLGSDDPSSFDKRIDVSEAIIELANDLSYHVGFKSKEDKEKEERRFQDQKKEKKAKKSGKKRGKKEKLSGMKLYPTEKMELKNPHSQPTAKNYQSMELIRNGPGISYEEYIDKDGLVKTLRNAIKRGDVIAKDS